MRLELARAAFPDDEVVLDEHPRTIDMLRAHPEWADPVFLIGADQFCDFLTWQEPDEVLERTRVAVATRPGFPRERLDEVLRALGSPERVLFFEIEPISVSSSGLAAPTSPTTRCRPRSRTSSDARACMPRRHGYTSPA